MRKFIGIALVAMCVLGTVAGVASARNGFAVESRRTATGIWTILGARDNIRCGVTLTTQFINNFTKTVGGSMGSVGLQLNTGSCTTGNAGLLVEGVRVTGSQTYSLSYQAFTGTLPRVTAIVFEIQNVTMWFTGAAGTCLTSAPVQVTSTTFRTTPAEGISYSADEIALTGEDIDCLFGSQTLTGSTTLNLPLEIILV